MKFNRPKGLQLRIALFSILFISNFFLCKTFAYAEETLRPAVTGKMDPISFALDGEKTTLGPTEAEILLQDVISGKTPPQIDKKNPVSETKKIPEPKKNETSFFSKIRLPWVEKPANEIKIEASKELDRIEKERAVKRKNIPKKEPAKKENKPFWSWPGGYDEPKISDGEALYRVAVSDKKITLKEAEEIGLANNLALQALKKRADAAEAKINEAKRAFYPTVQLQMEVNGGIVSSRFYKGENRKINMSQPLFYGGELEATLNQALESAKSVKAEYQKAKAGAVHQIRTSYYGVIRSQYNAQYQFELYDRVSNIYKRTKEAFRQKLVPEVDFLNLESQYQQVFFQVESTKNDVLSANLLLHQTLGLDAEEKLPIDLRIHYKKVSLEFNRLVQLAVDNNADVHSKAALLEAAKYSVKIYQAKKLPHVDLRGSYGMLGEQYADTTAITNDTRHNDLQKEWFFGVESSMPLGASSVDYSQVKHVYGPTVLSLNGSEDWRHHVAFNLWDKLSNITDEKSAQAALLQAQSDYDKTKNDLAIKIRDDFYTLQKSMIQVDSSTARIKYQEKQNMILEYMSGLQEASMTALVEGLISQAQDKFSFIQAVTDHELAKSSLSVSIGDTDYFEDKSERS